MAYTSHLALPWGLWWLLSCCAAAGEESCSAERRPPRESKPRWRSAPYGDLPDVLYGGQLVRRLFHEAGFDGPVETDDWDVLFTHAPVEEEPSLPERPWPQSRVVNHCRYFLAAGQKCALADHVQRVESALGRSEGQHRHLTTYSLMNRKQFQAWLSALEADPLKHWVIKTCTGGNAEEVRILKAADKEAAQAMSGEHAIAQPYLERPLRLWRGGKFHYRVYVLATRWAPAALFLYDEGFVQRSALPYDPTAPSRATMFSTGSDNVSLATLWDEIGRHRAAEVQGEIRGALAEIFGVAMEPSFGAFARKAGYHCFDLFGIDMMLDEGYRPYVLEVNQGPDLWAGESATRVIKGHLVKQVIAYATRRSNAPLDISVQEAEALENSTLATFTRII